MRADSFFTANRADTAGDDSQRSEQSNKNLCFHCGLCKHIVGKRQAPNKKLQASNLKLHRNPKSEGRMPKEARNPKSEDRRAVPPGIALAPASDSGAYRKKRDLPRISRDAGFRISFGLRISAFG